MKPQFNKLALASAVAIGMTAGGTQVQAGIVGNAGEALLVPLAVWSEGDFPVNTIVEIEVPASIGHEDIANIYTAPNTTPTNPGTLVQTADPDANGAIHWFWFDAQSIHRKNAVVGVTPNDIVQLSWQTLANGEFENETGYMVVTTETSAQYPSPGADFSMFGSAWLVSDEVEVVEGRVEYGAWSVSIPVIPMSDGPDNGKLYPTQFDEVVFDAGNVPTVSPLIGGIRTTYSDGVIGSHHTEFDIKLGDRDLPNIHVIWNDANLGSLGEGLIAYACDSSELCNSTSVDLPHEVNVLWIEDDFVASEVPEWATPVDMTNPSGDSMGMVRYYLPEYQDQGTGSSETAAVAFGLVSQIRYPVEIEQGTFILETVPAQDRGMFIGDIIQTPPDGRN